VRKLILSIAFVAFVCSGARADEAPVLTPIPDQRPIVGELFTYDVDATGDPAPTYSLGSAPNRMTIDSVTGVIEWTPTIDQTGSQGITVIATNSAGSDEVIMHVGVPLVAPVLAPIPDATVMVGEEWKYCVQLLDGSPNPGPTHSLPVHPDGMTIGVSWIHWTPTIVQVGANPVTVKVSNSSGSDTTSFVLNVEAGEEPRTFRLRTLSQGSGSVTTPGEGKFYYAEGTVVSITATPADGSHFVTWRGSAVSAGKVGDRFSPTTTVTMHADYQVEAVFNADTEEYHKLVVHQPSGGTIVRPSITYNFRHGSIVTLEARPYAGYRFVRWGGSAVDAGKVADASAINTTLLMDADYTLTAYFTLEGDPTSTLTISSTVGGSVLAPGEGSFEYDEGTSVSVVAQVEEEEYVFTGWSGTAVSAGQVTDTGAMSTKVTVDDDYTLVANFSPITDVTNALSVSAGVGGFILTPGEGTFACVPDTSVPVVALVQTGYEFREWTGTAVDAGKVANPSASSTSVFMDADYTLQANFTPTSTTSCTLSVSSSEGGAIAAPGEGTFECAPGSTVSIQVVAAGDYNFAGWTGTAVAAGKVADPTAASTTVTMDADYTLVAEFVRDTVVLELSSTDGGTVVMPGEGTFSYDYQEFVTLKAESEPGYHFVEWSGSFHASGNPATLEMDAHHQITAVFEANPFTLTISSGAGGSVIMPGEGVVICESDPNVCAVALPEAGYAFAGWSGTIVETGVLTDSTAARVDLLLEEDASLRASFEPVARCLYVDDDAVGDPFPGYAVVSDPAENGSWDHPFDAIGEAIGVAADGDVVLVLPGTYRENIAFAGKDIMVSAFDLAQPGAISGTTIVGVAADSVVVFEEGESSAASLVGFTIVSGEGELGGGIRCADADPIIAHCLITGNRADLGGGIYCQQSRAVLANCTIATNFTWLEGGGLYCDGDVAVINSILHGNIPEQIVAAPGRAPNVTYSVVEGSWPGAGNLDGDPRFLKWGHWSRPGGSDGAESPLYPVVEWIFGDYHLQAKGGHWNGWMWVSDGLTSRCVDAGNPQADVKWESRPHGYRLNMGAFGGTAEASRSSSN
jgi:Divergent InlB B-repeat domain/Putative Ig domain